MPGKGTCERTNGTCERRERRTHTLYPPP